MNIIQSVCRKLIQSNSAFLYNSLESPIQASVTVVRHRKGQRRKNRHTVQPFWHARVERTKYPEQLTKENEEFIGAVVTDTYKSISPVSLDSWSRGQWDSKSQRCGLIGKKLGSYPLWMVDGKAMLTTLLHISDNHVIKHVSAEELAANAFHNHARHAKRPRGRLVVGADGADPTQFTKEYTNMFQEVGVMPKKKLTSFLISDNSLIQPGTPLYATHFRPGDYVDISGYTIDHGFQGAMFRWGFKGMGKGHGQTKTHRKLGCTGYGGTRVLPGKKMHGHMGNQFRTARGIQVLRVNSKYNCIWVKGMLHGAVGDYMNIYDSGLWHRRHRDPDNHPPFPTHYPDEDPLEVEDWHFKGLFDMTKPSINFDEEDNQKKALK